MDPLPTFLIKECIDILLPSITKLVNCSLLEGLVPHVFKKAVVSPLIKKASLPVEDLKNYTPVSGLSFISKLVESVVAKQLVDHINRHGLDNSYKSGHSTETALLSIKADIHLQYIYLDNSGTPETPLVPLFSFAQGSNWLPWCTGLFHAGSPKYFALYLSTYHNTTILDIAGVLAISLMYQNFAYLYTKAYPPWLIFSYGFSVVPTYLCPWTLNLHIAIVLSRLRVHYSVEIKCYKSQIRIRI